MGHASIQWSFRYSVLHRCMCGLQVFNEGKKHILAVRFDITNADHFKDTLLVAKKQLGLSPVPD